VSSPPSRPEARRAIPRAFPGSGEIPASFQYPMVTKVNPWANRSSTELELVVIPQGTP
jgi:hypothetical protein